MRNIVALILTLYSPCLNAYGTSPGFLSASDTVALAVENGEKIYRHTVRQGQTLYAISRFYGMHYQELQYWNPGLGENLTVGQSIRIPIPNRAILRYLKGGVSRTQYAPVTYLVKKGDTAFRIGQYFKMPVDTVLSRGKIRNNILTPGAQIHIGWISILGISESDRIVPAHPLLKKNLPLRQRFENNIAGKKVVKDQGPAFWNKEAADQGNAFYARFNGAAQRSVLEIENPMNQGKIYVEVLGPIPPTVYDKNVKVVLSPAAARMLGARDAQFFVKIRYSK
ncbi:MAG: LysM peptidoglycan-binding domain-containing protein [Saprospiraceae bacterium]|jgi:LysM repeat protein